MGAVKTNRTCRKKLGIMGLNVVRRGRLYKVAIRIRGTMVQAREWPKDWLNNHRKMHGQPLIRRVMS